MKRILPFLMAFLYGSLCISLSAQNVGVGTNTPDASAKLDISSTNSGLLLPRVSLSDVTNGTTPVASPATGLLVYNTNAAVTGGDGTGFYYWDGAQWVKLVPSSGVSDDWSLSGNAGTNPVTDFLGTTDAQDLVIRTNSVEAMRVNDNGNVGIGTTSDLARTYSYVPAADATTNYGIRNEHYGSDNGVKYGIYSYTSGNGTGDHYGLRSYTYLNSSSNASAFGMRNETYTYGSGTHYGIYNYLYTASATGTHYGQRNYVYLNSASTAAAYGTFTYVDYTSGERYGNYLQLGSNGTYDGDVYGSYRQLYGTGDGVNYGSYNEMSASGAGLKYGVYNEMSTAGSGINYGVYNSFPAGNTSKRYGVWNEFADEAGDKYGSYVKVPTGTNNGYIYGMYMLSENGGTSPQYGTQIRLLNGLGTMRGHYVLVSPGATHSSTAYGIYCQVDDVGTGTHFGGLFVANGANAVGVKGISSGGWAGAFDGNVNVNGGLQVNDNASANYDVRMESVTYPEMFFLDASLDRVGIGTASPDQLLDVDNGSATGTQLGLGSIEYMEDHASGLAVSDHWIPLTDNVYDLGNVGLRWDDVYATNGVIQTSDRRDKTGIADLSYGLDEVMRLRPVSYRWKEGDKRLPETQQRRVGLIAQDVYEVVPEVVKTHDIRSFEAEDGTLTTEVVENERLGMNYAELVPVLINAIQELKAEVDELKSQIATGQGTGNEE